MERNIKQNPQKEADEEVKEVLLPLEVVVPEEEKQPTEKKLNSPQGPGGRVLRGPFGAF